MVARVLAAVSAFPPDTSCRKKTVPFLTHLPVVAFQLPPAELEKSGPLAAIWYGPFEEAPVQLCS